MVRYFSIYSVGVLTQVLKQHNSWPIVNPIPIKGVGRLCPPQYYWHPQIFWSLAMSTGFANPFKVFFRTMHIHFWVSQGLDNASRSWLVKTSLDNVRIMSPLWLGLNRLKLNYYTPKLEKGLGSNEFHIKWIFGTQYNWKKLNHGGRFWTTR